MRMCFVYLLMLIIQTQLYSQIQLEHTHSGEISRIRLQHAGEKYYVFHQNNNSLQLYNSNHSPWRTIFLPPDTSGLYNLLSVSDQALNGDTLLELICYFKSPGKQELRIWNEMGQNLLVVEGAYTCSLSKFQGLSSKLLVPVHNTETAVYAIPQFSLEHTYKNKAARHRIEVLGEKYFEQDNDSVLRIYNADHSLYKAVPTPWQFTGPFVSILHASQFRIMADSALEIVLQKNFGEIVMLNEQGKILFKSNNAVNFDISEIPGSPDKFCDYEAVYAIPGIIKEHTYKGYFPFKRLFASGPVFLMGWADSLLCFNTKHSLIGKVKMTLSSGYGITTYFHFSDNVFATDSKIEVAYGTMDGQSFVNKFQTRIINEDQSLIFIENGGLSLTVSEIGGGTQNKLLSFIADSVGTVVKTKVYGLPSYDLTGLKNKDQPKPAICLFPNPASDYIEFKHNGFAVREIKIYDVTGKLVLTKSDISEQIKVAGLTAGLYFVELRDEAGDFYSLKLLKQ